MKKQYKLIFSGPVGAGKSTAIRVLSDTLVLGTEALASDLTRQRKPTTTVAMDYGVMRLDGGLRVHLYGTPGQERFDFMWEILSEGGIGLVLLIDNARPAPLDDLAFYVSAFREFIDSGYLAVGVTRMDLASQPTLDGYAERLRELRIRAPVFEVDARRRADVAILVEALLHCRQAGAGHG
ncbi:GTP-binding protein [Pseudomonas sp. LRF_L74]|uniref:GTP-binding protein n=1 Tax=Pseudomonas sp. LRF_L74 TaxID=3369422 RepID=UPI003F60EE99